MAHMHWKVLCVVFLLFLAPYESSKSNRLLKRNFQGLGTFQYEDQVGWDHSQYLQEFQDRMKKKAKHLRDVSRRIRLKIRRCDEKCKELEGEEKRDCDVRKSKLKLILKQLQKRLKRTFFRLENGDHEEPPPEDLEVKIRREKATRKLKRLYASLEKKYKELKKKHYALKKERQGWVDKYRSRKVKLDEDYRHLRDGLMAKHLQNKAEMKRQIARARSEAEKKKTDAWELKKYKMQKKMQKSLKALKGNDVEKAKDRMDMLRKIEDSQKSEMEKFAMDQKKDRLDMMSDYRQNQTPKKVVKGHEYHHKHDNLNFDLDKPFNHGASAELHEMTGLSPDDKDDDLSDLNFDEDPEEKGDDSI